MGIFGWSYLPGCNSVPGDEDITCEICGEWEEDCICPECPECGDIGKVKNQPPDLTAGEFNRSE